MPIMRDIESILSKTKKNIIYLVTEDREILRDMFANISWLQDKFDQFKEKPSYCGPNNLYDMLTVNNYLIDCYSFFSLHKDLLAGNGKRLCAADTESPKASPFYMIMDFHIMDSKISAHFLKQFLDFAAQIKENLPAGKKAKEILLFLISPLKKIPEGFERTMEIIDVANFGEYEIKELLTHEAVSEKENALPANTGLTALEKRRIERITQEFKGLAKAQILETIDYLKNYKGTFFGDAGISETELNDLDELRKKEIKRQKELLVRQDDTITFLEPENAVAGLEGYKEWLTEIKTDLTNPEKAKKRGCKPAKGVLLTGVPGSGKTQTAKFTAKLMGENVSLVQFRIDKVLGGLVGESETKFNRCIKRIEALAPCVVLMDELEKQFKIDDDTHEVKMHIFSVLLDWMQENKKPVFLFATSNSVEGVKPELLRDGRIDMRFYVFMPNYDELSEIIKFHLNKVIKNAQKDLFSKELQTGIENGQISKNFLSGITAWGSDEGIHTFYTGANIENLIAQVQRKFRKADKINIKPEEYLKTMIDCAKSHACQPYGETNFDDIAKFWIGAYDKRYADASSVEENNAGVLFPFSGFKETKGGNDKTFKFTEEAKSRARANNRKNTYDEYMFDCVSLRIEQLYANRTKQ